LGEICISVLVSSLPLLTMQFLLRFRCWQFQIKIEGRRAIGDRQVQHVRANHKSDNSKHSLTPVSIFDLSTSLIQSSRTTKRMPTHRTAKAVVRNNIKKPMTAVSLIHRYSDVHRNKEDCVSSSLTRNQESCLYISVQEPSRLAATSCVRLDARTRDSGRGCAYSRRRSGAVAAATAVASGVSSILTNLDVTAS